VPRSVPDQGGRGHHDIGPCQQVLDHIGWPLDAGGRRETGMDAAPQQRDPGPWQPGLGRARQFRRRQHSELLRVDVGLQEPVEEHKAVRAGLIQPQRDLAR
jgi:hypothetical protein